MLLVTYTVEDTGQLGYDAVLLG